MIQRKQTLYLLVSGILMLMTLFLPVLKVVTPDMMYSFSASGFEDLSGDIVQPTWVFFGFNIAVILISFIAIFLYTKRVSQMRLTIFNLIIKVGFYVFVYLYYSIFTKDLGEYMSQWTANITPWLAFPLIAMIFDYLAYRGIAIDERTIRFMDRLR